MFIFEG